MNVYLRQGFLLIWDIFISANQQILRHSANAKQQIINQRIFKKVNFAGNDFFKFLNFLKKRLKFFKQWYWLKLWCLVPWGFFYYDWRAKSPTSLSLPPLNLNVPMVLLTISMKLRWYVSMKHYEILLTKSAVSKRN